VCQQQSADLTCTQLVQPLHGMVRRYVHALHNKQQQQQQRRQKSSGVPHFRQQVDMSGTAPLRCNHHAG
jgi:hypothetical protein